ncbi:MAG: threonine/serine exporter family protein [Clostridia bacterium]|nr:threonine/serine exporter family protein [Clostridia bacterium]
MELNEALRIVFSGLVGSGGFALFFRVRKSRILWATLGGGLTCVVYVISMKYFDHEFFQNLFPALFGAIYSEVMARVTKSPNTTYLACSIIPLVPGGKLYYTMYYFIIGEMDLFSEALKQTARISAGLAVGIITISVFVHIVNHGKFKQIYDIE